MLVLHRGSRGDRLAEGLTELLVGSAGDPFDGEVVSVPTRGVERWLTQHLSASLGARVGRPDGVCANVSFPFPGRVVGDVLAAATGVDRDRDPWAPERSVWALLRVVDGALGEPWLAQLAAHLGAGRGGEGDGSGDRRFAAVRHLADLFDRYGVHRPELLLGWAAGEDPPLADLAWQAELWRRLRQAIGEPSPAERLGDACSVVRSDPTVADLPARVSLFGLTRLPASYLQVLVALARERDVHLWLLHPSATLWAAVRSAGLSTGPRRLDRSAAVAAHPLLRTWGRDAREMQLVLTEAGVVTEDALADPEAVETLLGRIQSDIRADRAPASGPDRAVLDPGDRSIEIHACHGRARQVQVLRHAILHALTDDPTLEPRDVIVLCPDIEELAPLVAATFGVSGGADGVELPVRLADRSLRQTNPILAGVTRLLDLVSGRVTASDLLDLAGSPPVRQRFGFDDEELSRLDTWVRTAGVRWGLDTDGRRAFKLGSVADGTWRRGLDRILVGVAVAEEPPALIGGVLPLDDVDSGDIDLAGRLAELVDRVGVALDALGGPQPADRWGEAIDRAASLLFAVGPGDEWQSEQLHQMLSDVEAELTASSAVGAVPELTIGEVRSLLADRLRGVPTRANFRTGHITFCTLVPMRSVPHRVICLLGLDDGAFPRRTAPDTDDIIASEPRTGDRDPRSEDRQLLLDALLAARDRLIITYSGHDERTNAPRPPAVPVGELLETIDRTVVCAAGDDVASSERVTVHHPLQPFDDRCFGGEGGVGRPWSFDSAALAGARARRRLRPARPDGFADRLPAVRPDPLALDDLIAFVAFPVRAFLRQRLGLSIRADGDEPGDALTVEIDPLAAWAVGDRLLASRLAGLDAATCVRSELARGTLPPGRRGEREVERIMVRVEALVAAAGPQSGAPASVDVTATVAGGTGAGVVLAGTVGGLFGHQLRSVIYSRLGAKHRATAWVRLVALSASAPEHPWEAVTIGRADRGDAVSVARIGPLGASAQERATIASAALATVVDLHLRGLREPLPLGAKTALGWAEAVRRGQDPVLRARSAWETGPGDLFDREDRERAHVVAFGRPVSWTDLCAIDPADDERGPGWDGHPSRVGRLALRLWDGPLTHETVQSPQSPGRR